MDCVCTAAPLYAEEWQKGFGIRGRHLWIGAALLLLMAAPVQAKVLVTDVSFAPRSDGEGYVVRAHTTQEPEGYFFSQSDSGQKLTWILYNATLHEDYQHSAPEGPVKRYTTTRRNGHLVLQVHLAENRSVSPAAYRDGASTDLLLSLTYEGPVPVANAPSPSTGTGGTNETDDTSEESGTGKAGSADPISQASRKRSRLDTVVIDPGHGGKDPGAMAHGQEEKDIVLDVAHRLGDYIENRLDLEVAYTRTDDRFIALEERGHFANRIGGDLFLSLHVNAAPSAAVQGTETYFLGRSKTDAARRVMQRENSVVRQYEKNPDRYEEYDSEAFVRGELFLSASMQFSEEFAKRVQKQFKRRVERRSRGVKQAGFYVLWSASMPSVLVELGFLTNREEARYLNSDRGQTKLAKALFRAVKSYKDEYNKGVVASE